jgi:hypothetical protein
MTDEEKARFRTLRSEFTTAALALLEAWKDGGEFTTGYPFKESFGDVVHGIIAWNDDDDTYTALG